MANPFRIDPSGTGLLRQKYEREMLWRFKEIGVAADTFIRTRLQIPITANARYKFPSNTARAGEFDKWLTGKVKAGLLTNWQSGYIKSAYRSGLVHGYTASQRNVEALEPEPLNAFLKEAFDVAESTEKLQKLYSRAFENLKGVTKDMAKNLREVLTQGLADGKNPRVIGREIAHKVAGIGRDRGLKIARTETIYAHSEAQLDAFERLGIESVGAEVEWLSTPDAKRCELCADLHGKQFTLAEARGMLPRHPNCRCSWTPVVAVPGT